MRKILFALIFAVTALSFTAPASAQSAEPGCSVHVGGLCGRDLRNWCLTWARTNHGRFAMPAECGRSQRYGGFPQQRFYGGRQFGRRNVQVIRIRTLHRHEEHHEARVTDVPAARPMEISNVGYVPPGFHIVH